MALYLDTEFNGFGGELISLALYNTQKFSTGRFYHFYAAIHPKAELVPWVKENVIPELNTPYTRKEVFVITLRNYLLAYGQYTTIYADWPEDFKHLLDQCYGVNGAKYIPQLKMELITVPDTHRSKIPHNAFEDAMALHLNHMEMLKNASNDPTTKTA